MKTYLFFIIALLTFIKSSAQILTPGFTTEKFLHKSQRDLYTVKLKQGEYLNVALIQKSVDVIIDAVDPSGKKIKSFDSPNGNNGPEPIKFLADASGDYRLEVHPYDDPNGYTDSAFKALLDSNQGKYAIDSVIILSHRQYEQMLTDEKAKQEQIIHWIGANSITVKSDSDFDNFDDLQPLKSILKNVKYVGLGEATHGTSEFFLMKHRMLEFLVKEMGFTVFAIEDAYSGCQNINDYVMYGKGDAHTALASQGFWVWDTKEMIDMIEWMHSYNQTVPDDKKVRFMGFDNQRNDKGGAAAIIEAYLQKVAPLHLKEMKTLLDSVDAEGSKHADSLRKIYINFLGFFVMSHGNFVQKTSEQEYESVLEQVKTIGQYLDESGNHNKDTIQWRDYYMASNFMHFVETEKPGTKFVVWAHNAHISHNARSFVSSAIHSFGSYLQQAYGNDYYAFGFAFNSGGFQAMQVDTLNNFYGLQPFTLHPAKEYSLNWYYAQTGKPLFIINFKNDSMPSFMKSFFNHQMDTWDFGSQVFPPFLENYYSPIIPNVDFDGMIFINSTHRAHPTLTGMRKTKE